MTSAVTPSNNEKPSTASNPEKKAWCSIWPWASGASVSWPDAVVQTLTVAPVRMPASVVTWPVVLTPPTIQRTGTGARYTAPYGSFCGFGAPCVTTAPTWCQAARSARAVAAPPSQDHRPPPSATSRVTMRNTATRASVARASIRSTGRRSGLWSGRSPLTTRDHEFTRDPGLPPDAVVLRHLRIAGQPPPSRTFAPSLPTVAEDNWPNPHGWRYRLPVERGPQVMGGPQTAGGFDPSGGSLADENARLYEEAQRQHRWLQASGVVATSLLSGTDPRQVLGAITAQVQELSGADLVVVGLPEDGGRPLTITASAAGSAPRESGGRSGPPGRPRGGQRRPGA